MNVRKITKEDQKTTAWSGGTTTELAIAPAGAIYADRDFLWRISSAVVEDETSTFTALPDYHRLLSVREGDMKLWVGDKPEITLEPMKICSFDGGTPVHSEGRCTDFNVMGRKGQCATSLSALKVKKGESAMVTAAVMAPKTYPSTTVAIFCDKGSIAIDEWTLTAGELLLIEDTKEQTFSVNAAEDSLVLIATIWYN